MRDFTERGLLFLRFYILNGRYTYKEKRMKHQWYEDALIYHIYSLSLAGAPFLNDYAVLEHKLAEFEKWIPHIKGMGFNAVLFSPVLKSRSHGYDVTDYFMIDNRIGANDEFKSLVKQFHENGIRVILDSVFNHCGRDFSLSGSYGTTTAILPIGFQAWISTNKVR